MEETPASGKHRASEEALPPASAGPGIRELIAGVDNSLAAAQAQAYLASAIVESSDDAIIGKTPDGIITHWNAAAERLYGYGAGEAIGRNIDILQPVGRQDEMTLILERIRRGERVEHFETERMTKDGRILDVSLTVSPIKDSSGNIIGASSIARDATATKRASLYARSLIEASLDPLVTISAEGQITDVNEATVQVTGVSREDLIGTDFSSYFTEPAKARAGYQQVFEKGFVTDYPLTIRHALGAETDVLYNAAVYRDDRGEVLGVFAAARDVTAIKRAEEEVRQARDFLENVVDTFNALPDIFYTFDMEGRFLRWNQALSDISGYRNDEIAAMRPTDFFEGESATRIAEAIERTKREGHVVVEAEMSTKEGRKIPYDFAAGLLKNSRGEALGLTGMGRDITERKRAEEELRTTRDFLEHLVDYANAPIIVWDPEFRITRFNHAFEYLTGYKSGEVLGHRLEMLFPADPRRDEAMAHIRRTMRGERWEAVEIPILQRDGHVRIVLWNSATLYDEDGSTPIAMIAQGQDITERKEAEIVIRESEARYRAIFEYTGAAKCTIEPDLVISSTNYEFERMIDRATEGIVGNTSILEFIAPQAVGEFTANFKDLAYDPTEVTRHFESIITGKDGPIYVIGSMALIPGSQTAALSLIDITLEKTYERTLEERAEQLSDFLSIAAHELGLPVTVIKGYIQILRDFRDRLDSERIEDVLASIDDASNRLAHLVDELLDASRIEKGRLSMSFGEMDLASMLENALAEARLKGRENEITMRIEGELPPMRGDQEKLMQAVHILLENAAKFSPVKSPIEVVASQCEGELIVSVLDAGIGVKEEARGRIFERFYQVEDASHHSKPGLGLGLSIASEIVAAHGGRIWHEERPGGGSIFRFALPLQAG